MQSFAGREQKNKPNVEILDLFLGCDSSFFMVSWTQEAGLWYWDHGTCTAKMTRKEHNGAPELTYSGWSRRTQTQLALNDVVRKDWLLVVLHSRCREQGKRKQKETLAYLPFLIPLISHHKFWWTMRWDGSRLEVCSTSVHGVAGLGDALVAVARVQGRNAMRLILNHDWWYNCGFRNWRGQ